MVEEAKECTLTSVRGDASQCEWFACNDIGMHAVPRAPLNKSLGGLDTREELTKARKLLEAGSEIAGAAVGGALGFLAGGPGMAAGASVVGAVTAKSLQEFCARQLSRREEERIGAVTSLALCAMKRKLDEGREPRQDGFFDEGVSGRSDADEVLEGVLLRAKGENEEKKAPYLANLIASVAFDSAVSRDRANFFIRLVDQISYRQLCYVSLVGLIGCLNVENLRKRNHDDVELEVLKREEMSLHSNDLGTLGLLHGAGPWDDVLSVLGLSFYEALGLAEVPREELNKVAVLLEKAGCPVVLPSYAKQGQEPNEALEST